MSSQPDDKTRQREKAQERKELERIINDPKAPQAIKDKAKEALDNGQY